MRPAWPALLVIVLAGCSGTAAEPDVAAAIAFLASDPPGADEARVLQAVAIAGLDPATWPSPEDAWLDRVDPPGAGDAWTDALWLTHGLAASGHDPRDFRGVDLVDRIRSSFDGAQFGSAATLADDMWAVIALRAAGEPAGDDAIAAAADRLVAAQAGDGGWAWDGGPGSPDETAWALAALQAAGRLDEVQADARRFLEAAAGVDGAYAASGVRANCQSTALALWARGVVGLGAPDESMRYLASCQKADGGFAHRPGGPSDAWATVDVVMALAQLP